MTAQPSNRNPGRVSPRACSRLTHISVYQEFTHKLDIFSVSHTYPHAHPNPMISFLSSSLSPPFYPSLFFSLSLSYSNMHISIHTNSICVSLHPPLSATSVFCVCGRPKATGFFKGLKSLSANVHSGPCLNRESDWVPKERSKGEPGNGREEEGNMCI